MGDGTAQSAEYEFRVPPLPGAKKITIIACSSPPLAIHFQSAYLHVAFQPLPCVPYQPREWTENERDFPDYSRSL